MADPHDINKTLNDLLVKLAVIDSKLTDIKSSEEKQSELIDELERDVRDLQHEIRIVKDEMSSIKDDVNEAFPDGDKAKHRIYHENEDINAGNISKIKGEVVSHIFKGVFWAALIALFWAAVDNLKAFLKASS